MVSSVRTGSRPAAVATRSSSSSDPLHMGAGYEYDGFLACVKVLGLMSMLAAGLILRDVAIRLRRKPRSNSSWRGRVTLTQCVIFCMSTGDFFSAFFVQFLSTWMVPSFVEVSYASGTLASCTAQGFIGVLFYSLSAASNASLAVAYCLIVKFGWRDSDKDRYRLPFLLTPIACAVVMAVTPLFGQHYNYNGGFFCDIAESPLGCNWPGSAYPCVRGAEARMMLLCVGVIPYMIAFTIIIAAMVLLSHAVLLQERRMDRYRQQGDSSPARNMTRQTTRQGIYYILAFGMAWIPWYSYSIIEVQQRHDVPEWLAAVHYTTMPLQGVFNALVYFRPKYKSDRSSHPSESRTSSVLRVLKISLPDAGCFRRKEPQQVPDDARDVSNEEGLAAQQQATKKVEAAADGVGHEMAGLDVKANSDV